MGIMLGAKKSEFNEMDTKVVNNIKSLAIDMINEAQSGHPGIVLSSAPIIYDIYAKHLNFDIKNDKWINRDRFIMSCGHGSALLYATLFMSGFDLELEDLKKFRKLSSITPGHPEYNITPGVDVSTGPLGQGFANAVGIAIGEKFLNTRFAVEKESLINHFTYVLCSDGDLMEGISYESASIAGNLGLGKLIVLYDSNNMSLDRNTSQTCKENVIDRFKAMNWDTQIITNGNDLNAIDNAITKAKEVTDKPSIIEVKTILGFGSRLQNTNAVHGKPLDLEDITKLKASLDIRDVPFTVSNDAYNYMQEQVTTRNEALIKTWNSIYERIINKVEPYLQEEIKNLITNNLYFNLDKLFINVTEELEEAPRDTSNRILNSFIKEDLPMLVGSADLASSTKVYLNNMGDFTSTNPKGRNILFGVREHAMGAIINGLCISGIRSIGSTFLVFSDYLKPAIRMAALMKLPVIYIFTHDSILVGEDGPTHQPVEQLISLRSIPNTTVYRPCDANEILGAYKSALNNTEGPSIIVLSKDKIKVFNETKINDIDKGAYILKNNEPSMGTIIATGKEVELAMKIANSLEDKNIKVKVVSMPSIERFEKQDQEYKDSILPLTTKKIVIEFSSPYSWYKYVYNEKYLFTINDFGMSCNKDDILNHFNLNKNQIEEKIEKLLR